MANNSSYISTCISCFKLNVLDIVMFLNVVEISSEVITLSVKKEIVSVAQLVSALGC